MRAFLSREERAMLEEHDPAPRERDENSSLQSQYEDSVLPEREFEYESGS